MPRGAGQESARDQGPCRVMIKIVFILRIRIQISSLEKISSFISNHECIRPVVTKSPVKRSVFFSFFHLAFLVQINSDLSSSGATRALRAKLDIEKDPMDDITTVYQTQDIYIYCAFRFDFKKIMEGKIANNSSTHVRTKH